MRAQGHHFHDIEWRVYACGVRAHALQMKQLGRGGAGGSKVGDGSWQFLRPDHELHPFYVFMKVRVCVRGVGACLRGCVVRACVRANTLARESPPVGTSDPVG